MNHQQVRFTLLSTPTRALTATGLLLFVATGCAADASDADTDQGGSSQGGSSAAGNQTGGTSAGSSNAGSGGASTAGSTTSGSGGQETSSNGGSAGATVAGTGGAGGSGPAGGSGGTGGAGGDSADSGGMGGSGEAGADTSDGGVGGTSDDVGGQGNDEAGAGGAAEDDDTMPDVTGGDPVKSSGCGQASPGSNTYTIDVGGMSREYILAVPDNYDPEKAYRLVFTWHPWGGSAQQVAGNGPNGYYGLLGASGGEAILVSPEGLDFGGNGLGWGNEGGQDIAFLEAMMERFDEELCFDHSRVFSTGFSFGGMMSNAVACAGLARAIAPMAGNSQVSGCEAGDQPVAYMGFHGDADSVVSISGGETARDVFVERNNCGAAGPSDSDWCDLAGGNYQPCECTTYEGCDDGYPVTWCEFSGNHMVAPNSAETIWNFFSQF